MYDCRKLGLHRALVPLWMAVRDSATKLACEENPSLFPSDGHTLFAISLHHVQRQVDLSSGRQHLYLTLKIYSASRGSYRLTGRDPMHGEPDLRAAKIARLWTCSSPLFHLRRVSTCPCDYRRY